MLLKISKSHNYQLCTINTINIITFFTLEHHPPKLLNTYPIEHAEQELLLEQEEHPAEHE